MLVGVMVGGAGVLVGATGVDVGGTGVGAGLPEDQVERYVAGRPSLSGKAQVADAEDCSQSQQLPGS